MTKKIFHGKQNYQNEKKKTTPRTKRDSIGQLTGILDINGEEIVTGRKYSIDDAVGVVLWNRYEKTYSLYYAMNPYGNPMEIESYNKHIPIRSDNGMRMRIIPHA